MQDSTDEVYGEEKRAHHAHFKNGRETEMLHTGKMMALSPVAERGR